MFIDNQGYIKLINIEGFCQEWNQKLNQQY
jgi:hypothetical protein